MLAALSASAQPPEAVRTLDREYRRRLDEACAPVNQWYIAELLKIYIDLRVQNQNTDADTVAQFIHSIAPEVVLPELPATPEHPLKTSETETPPAAIGAEPPPLPEPTPAPTPVPAVTVSSPAASELPAAQIVAPTAPTSPEAALQELDRMKKILPDISAFPVLMTYELPASEARLTGDVRFDNKDISLWRGYDSQAAWTIPDLKPGLYEISLLYSTDISAPGPFEIHLGDQTLHCKTIDRTGSWHKYRKCAVGRLQVAGGKTDVFVLKKDRGGFLFNLKMLYLDEVLPEKETVRE